MGVPAAALLALALAVPAAAADLVAVVIEVSGVWRIEPAGEMVTQGSALRAGAELRCSDATDRIKIARYDGTTAARVCGAGGRNKPFVVSALKAPSPASQRLLDAVWSLIHRPQHPYAVANSRGDAVPPSECVLVPMGDYLQARPLRCAGTAPQLVLRPITSEHRLGKLSRAVSARAEGSRLIPDDWKKVEPGLVSLYPAPDERRDGTRASLGAWALVTRPEDPRGRATLFEGAEATVSGWDTTDDTRRLFLRAYLDTLSRP